MTSSTHVLCSVFIHRNKGTDKPQLLRNRSRGEQTERRRRLEQGGSGKDGPCGWSAAMPIVSISLSLPPTSSPISVLRPGGEQTVDGWSPNRFGVRQASIELRTAGCRCCRRGRRAEMCGAVGCAALREDLMPCRWESLRRERAKR